MGRMKKVSVTIDEDVLAEARRLAPEGNLSALVVEALEARVRNERLREAVEWFRAQGGFDSEPPGHREYVREQLARVRRR